MSLIKRSDWPTTKGSFLSDFFDDERFFGSPWLRGQQAPAVNVKETDKNYEVEVAAPGFNKEDFDVTLEHGLLTISAEKKEEAEKKEDRYTRREFEYTQFSRSFSLPKNVNEEDVKASYESGVLKLLITKKEFPGTKPRKSIQIK
jgi:HSP20 family protein